jgi:8-oxo-dGTP pyrophosphatase MutT (NUDIX family)
VHSGARLNPGSTKGTTALPADWRERLTASVTPLRDGVRSLEIMGYRPPGADGYRPGRTAAVLVPVLDQAEPEILLTRRAEHLANHAGQISFPGGAADRADDSAVQTALREAREEIGLDPANVTPLGFLDRYDVISDYRVLPVVGLVKPPSRWVIDDREVSGVITLPLAYAIDRGNYARRRVRHEQISYEIYSIEWMGNTVWGATAAMLLNLASRMSGQAPD